MVRDFPRPAIVILSITVLAVAVLLFGGAGLPPRSVWFSQSTKDLKAYDFVEITAQVSAPHASNPFTDAVIRGTFERVADGKRWQVEGFCDAEDGSVYRIRFDRDVSCERRPPPRPDPDRSQEQMAFRLGRYRRALLLQRDNRVLAHQLAG